MQPSLFPTIRRLVATRAMRIVFLFVFAMCSVTWVAQSVSAIHDNPRVPGSNAAATMAAAKSVDLAAAKALAVQVGDEAADCAGNNERDECEADVVALVALDETHDIKLFFLREFTHQLQAAVGRIPRNRDFGAISRMSSETFRPPDSLVGVQGRLLQA